MVPPRADPAHPLGVSTPPALDRRTFLRLSAATGATVVLSATAGAPTARADTGLRVHVLVVDGLRPDDVTPLLTPRLHASTVGRLFGLSAPAGGWEGRARG